MTTATLPTKTNTTFTDGPLPILLSCRVRLNDQQRQTLRDAYNEKERSTAPAPGQSIGGSFVRAETSYGNKNLLPRLVFSDLVASRDSIALPALLELQKTLGVVVIDKEAVTAAAASYVAYMFDSQAGN